MSADNWTICPKCHRVEEQRIADVQAAARAAYGVAPAEEYEAMRAEAAVPIDLETVQTLREDYEIYGAATGVVKVCYSGRCKKCDLELKFEYERAFEGLS